MDLKKTSILLLRLMPEFPTVAHARLPPDTFSAGELAIKQGGVFSC